MMLPSLWEIAAALDRVAPVLLDMALRSLVVLGLAGLAVATMRRASAAARHWVWLLGFAGLLLLPVVSAVMPGWQVLPRLGAGDGSLVGGPIAAGPVAPIPDSPVQVAVKTNDAPSIPPYGLTVAHPVETVVPQPAAPVQATGPISTVAHIPAAAKPAALPWAFWLVLAWLTGSLLLLGHVALGHLSLWFLRRRCAPVREGELQELLNALRRDHPTRQTVELLLSPLRTMPMTWGLWRTRLLLPVQSTSWSTEQCRSVLLHELGHVRRCDCLTQFLAQIACALYWFNPLVWVAWRRMQVERERACDDLVLNTGARASAYADHLLQSASAMPVLRFVGPAVAMARPSTLEERLRAILDGRRNRRTLSRKAAATTLLLLVAAVVPVAALRAQGNPSQDVSIAGGGAGGRGGAAENPATPVTAEPGSRPAATAPSAGRAARGGRGVGGLDLAQGPAPALGSGPTCTLDATIYDVRVPVDQIGRIDIEALTRASVSAPAFEKALAELGTSQPLYRANQSVRLSEDFISISTQTPYIASTTITRDGGVVNVPSWYATGASFSLAGKSTDSGMELDMLVQISTLTDSATTINGDLKAPLFRSARLSHKGTVEALKPFVIVSVDAASRDANGKAVAYIGRITLGAPQTSGGPARGR